MHLGTHALVPPHAKALANPLVGSQFLPIAETRFQRKRPPKEENASPLPSPSIASARPPARALSLNLPRMADSPPVYSLPPNSTVNSLGSPAYHLDPNHSHSNASSPDQSNGFQPHRKEPRYVSHPILLAILSLLMQRNFSLVGPTSISHLMHSTSTFPVERMGPVDFKLVPSFPLFFFPFLTSAFCAGMPNRSQLMTRGMASFE